MKSIKTALVGNTGFVGSNLAASFPFEGLYNSKNIAEAYGTKPALLIYAGVRAEKYLADANPEKDFAAMREALENIREIGPQKLVLISTVDVYRTPEGVDERSEVETFGLRAYGANRYFLECEVRERYPDASIVRLPALFGRGLKKNFIYDYMHRIPTMLSSARMEELSVRISGLADYYRQQENGFYRRIPLDRRRERSLREQFETAGFTALSFTDSRSSYQFYNLEHLWGEIQEMLKLGLPLLNLATEPMTASELYEYLAGETFENLLPTRCARYNFKSIYAEAMGGQNGYLYAKEQVMREIKTYVGREMQEG